MYDLGPAVAKARMTAVLRMAGSMAAPALTAVLRPRAVRFLYFEGSFAIRVMFFPRAP
jgi:hypothetical protein